MLFSCITSFWDTPHNAVNSRRLFSYEVSHVKALGTNNRDFSLLEQTWFQMKTVHLRAVWKSLFGQRVYGLFRYVTPLCVAPNQLLVIDRTTTLPSRTQTIILPEEIQEEEEEAERLLVR